MLNQQKFSNLNLFTLKYPLTAITSLLHRISGIFVFLLIPLLLWMFDTALFSASSFTSVKTWGNHGVFRFVIWLTSVALGYHLIAGIRHLVMDLGWGETLFEARVTAVLTFIFSIIWAILVGIWLW